MLTWCYKYFCPFLMGISRDRPVPSPVLWSCFPGLGSSPSLMSLSVPVVPTPTHDTLTPIPVEHHRQRLHSHWWRLSLLRRASAGCPTQRVGIRPSSYSCRLCSCLPKAVCIVDPSQADLLVDKYFYLSTLYYPSSLFSTQQSTFDKSSVSSNAFLTKGNVEAFALVLIQNVAMFL